MSTFSPRRFHRLSLFQRYLATPSLVLDPIVPVISTPVSPVELDALMASLAGDLCLADGFSPGIVLENGPAVFSIRDVPPLLSYLLVAFKARTYIYPLIFRRSRREVPADFLEFCGQPIGLFRGLTQTPRSDHQLSLQWKDTRLQWCPRSTLRDVSD